MQRLNILAIASDQKDKELLQNKLTPLGSELLFAQNAKEGLRLFIKHKPEIIICSTRIDDFESTGFIKKVKFGNSLSTLFLFDTQEGCTLLARSINDGVDYCLENALDSTEMKEAIYKCHQKNIEKKSVENTLNRLKNISDSYPNISFLCRGNEIVEANAKFLEFFDCLDIATFKQRFGHFGDTLVNTSDIPKIEDKKNWLGKLIELQPHNRKIALRNYASKLHYFLLNVSKYQAANGYFIINLTDISMLEKEYKSKLTQVTPQQEAPSAQQPDKPSAEDDEKTLNKLLKILSVEIHRSNRYGVNFSSVMLSYMQPDGSPIKAPSVPNIIEKLIKAKIRPTDSYEKISKYKFLILLSHTGIEGCNHLIERLLDELNKNEILKDYNCCYKLVGAEHRKNETLNLFIKRMSNYMGIITKKPGSQKLLADNEITYEDSN